MAQNYNLTQARFNELEQELHYLRTVREKEVAEMVKTARAFGDLSENSEYDEANNEQARLFARITELDDILQNAVIIEIGDTEGAVVIGSTVNVINQADKSKHTFVIMGSLEANPLENKISNESPMGSALMGAVEGDNVTVFAPAGKIEYKIEKVT